MPDDERPCFWCGSEIEHTHPRIEDMTTAEQESAYRRIKVSSFFQEEHCDA